MRNREKAYVHGSHGVLTINKLTGKVLECDECGGDYKEIVNFNIEEHMAWWHLTEPRESYDILDLGYWEGMGGYTSPEIDWRKDLLKEKNCEAKEFLTLLEESVAAIEKIKDITQDILPKDREFCGWSSEDVRHTAEEMEVKLTEDEIDQVIDNIEHHFDANCGLNWEGIEMAIDTVRTVEKTK